MNRSLLFYNLYPKDRWQEITASLLQNVPHDDIIVHVALPLLGWFNKGAIQMELDRYPKVKQVIFSKNKKRVGETVGLEKLQTQVDLGPYSILTYIHSKGSSKAKKNTQAIKDWTEFMRYFVIERLDLAKEAFQNNFYLYGVNLSTNMHPRNIDKVKHPDTKFIFEGNFVSVNLNQLKEEVLETKCRKDYYGVERFWGRLCSIDKAFSQHQANIDHYHETYLPEEYVDKNA